MLILKFRNFILKFWILQKIVFNLCIFASTLFSSFYSNYLILISYQQYYKKIHVIKSHHERSGLAREVYDITRKIQESLQYNLALAMDDIKSIGNPFGKKKWKQNKSFVWLFPMVKLGVRFTVYTSMGFGLVFLPCGPINCVTCLTNRPTYSISG